MNIRPLLPDDKLEAVSHIYEASWKSAYRGIVPQAYLDSLSQRGWTSFLTASGHDTLLLCDKNTPVGVCAYGPSRWPTWPQQGEIISLYLLDAYIGKGYGRALLQTAVDALIKHGYREIFLWVLEENRRARDFYAAYGFTASAEYTQTDIGGKPLREIRYVYTPPCFSR